ncbi:ead/Ea22-like family protein [Escherichia coli]|uniref:ead/Ea22-like family protein n=1 Tax=Escherichia coli TaxID=562 RepID=UPI000930B71A|nr:ead/Ea22-like family protein [Escherichia coli]MCN2476741.1 ead/Ea22-like family protein [Escherichia coli]MCN2694825.1 ead/Ea22-like family protein [Escherichia coli]MCN7028859.1 ead/Ea22-like family protein [Escherichia coli]MCN7658865.1 ead/Ea22-like family protein [Escherichia coli]MCN9075605.1 ead/Ea22-like family protein [Escherichia coli]
MSKIDYQALREKAEKATCGVWSLEYGEERFDADDALIHREVAGYIPICRIEGAHPESGFDEDFQMEQQANAEFIAAANPATVLALLDELEAKDNRINRLEAIVAVAEQRNALMREWKRALKVPCYLVDNQVPVVIHGMIIRLERLKETEAKLEAAEKRIAELSHHLQCAHGFIEHTEAFGHEASNGILCCGDAQWNIDASKLALAAAGKGEAS